MAVWYPTANLIPTNNMYTLNNYNTCTIFLAYSISVMVYDTEHSGDNNNTVLMVHFTNINTMVLMKHQHQSGISTSPRHQKIQLHFNKRWSPRHTFGSEYHYPYPYTICMPHGLITMR